MRALSRPGAGRPGRSPAARIKLPHCRNSTFGSRGPRADSQPISQSILAGITALWECWLEFRPIGAGMMKNSASANAATRNIPHHELVRNVDTDPLDLDRWRPLHEACDRLCMQKPKN